MRLIRDGEKGEKGYGGGGRGKLYTYRYTVTTRMTSALRLAAVRAILMFHNCEGQSHKTMPKDYNFWRERRAEADSNRGPSAYQPNALPLGQTGSLRKWQGISVFIRYWLFSFHGVDFLFCACVCWTVEIVGLGKPEFPSHFEQRVTYFVWFAADAVTCVTVNTQ